MPLNISPLLDRFLQYFHIRKLIEIIEKCSLSTAYISLHNNSKRPFGWFVIRNDFVHAFKNGFKNRSSPGISSWWLLNKIIQPLASWRARDLTTMGPFPPSTAQRWNVSLMIRLYNNKGIEKIVDVYLILRLQQFFAAMPRETTMDLVTEKKISPFLKLLWNKAKPCS